jgi:hypothetical protein
MIAYAAARGIDVTTTTTLLTISDALEECVASGVRRIDVAPGAAHPSDCDYLRPARGAASTSEPLARRCLVQC